MATRALARLGDLSTHTAVIITTNQDGTVFCEGKEVAVDRALLAPHGALTPHPLIINGNLATTLFINGKAVVLNNSTAQYGAKIIAGATKTFGT